VLFGARYDEDITMLKTHTLRPFPCWTSSPTQLPRPSRIQPTLTHGFGDNSIIWRRNEVYKYSLETGRRHRRFGSGPSSRSRVDHAMWPRQGAAPPILGQLGRVSSRALGPSRGRPLLVSHNPSFLSSNSRRYRFVKPQRSCVNHSCAESLFWELLLSSSCLCSLFHRQGLAFAARSTRLWHGW
jgi:hypothetical protein